MIDNLNSLVDRLKVIDTISDLTLVVRQDDYDVESSSFSLSVGRATTLRLNSELIIFSLTDYQWVI
jgi:hypothetical protein